MITKNVITFLFFIGGRGEAGSKGDKGAKGDKGDTGLGGLAGTPGTPGPQVSHIVLFATVKRFTKWNLFSLLWILSQFVLKSTNYFTL